VDAVDEVESPLLQALGAVVEDLGALGENGRDVPQLLGRLTQRVSCVHVSDEYRIEIIERP
jgi:hypothetical protein